LLIDIAKGREVSRKKKFTDEEFVEQWLLSRHTILRFCRSMLWFKDEATAEDAAQETFVRAWRGRHEFEGASSLQTWFCQIARNICIDQTRAKKNDVSIGEVCTNGEPNPPYSKYFKNKELDAFAKLADREVGPYWDQLIASAPLTDNERTVILLRIGNMPFSEIAAIIGCDIKTARTHRFRAAVKIERALRVRFSRPPVEG
jgi:RNA polymerase sigma-70 factor (ECF subfamily)